MAAGFKSVKSQSLRECVEDSIRAAIFSGKLRPGDALREMHLARELQVSQATVREALLHLEHAGLVTRTPNAGTIVTRLTSEELRERIVMRVLLEQHAAGEAALRMNAKDVTVLQANLDSLASAIARNAYYESAQADLDFHRFVWLKSGNQTLYRTLDALAAPFFAYISILRGDGLEKLDAVVRSHKPIVTACKQGNAEGARAAMRTHIESSYTRLTGSSMADTARTDPAQPHDLTCELRFSSLFGLAR